MNSAHLHIVLNHFPFIITAIALLVAGVAFVTQQAVIKRLALGMMVLIALSAAAAFFTGLAAEEEKFGPGSPAMAQIERHEASARVTWIVGLVVGAVGIAGLLMSRRVTEVPMPIMATAVVALLVSAFFFMRTSNLGGQISHPEIRSDPVSKAFTPE
ncbi:MAG: hypothetical protein IIC73_00175 [Armatimonadetes bacterium]|nr:hypothetical protein [Armatimonadota bacterium]